MFHEFGKFQPINNSTFIPDKAHNHAICVMYIWDEKQGTQMSV